MQIAYTNIASLQTTWHTLYVTPPLSTTPHHSDMAGSWWVVTVTLFTTHDLLSQCMYLHQGHMKRVMKMKTMREMTMEMMMYREEEEIHQNLMNKIMRQNALTRTKYISFCVIDSSVAMLSQCNV